MKIVDEELQWQIKNVVVNWLPAREIVEKAFKERISVHESGKIIKFDTSCKWQSHLYDIEKDHKSEGAILFILF